MPYNNSQINEEELNNLTEEEREIVFKILNEFADTGTSQILDDLNMADYNERPVDIKTFIHDKRYLGSGLTNSDGRFTLFSYWEDLLIKLYPNPYEPPVINTLALSGAIGIGKSTVGVLVVAYELYKMMCLKDPYVYYGIQNIDTISFALINITKDAARGVAWDKLQNLLKSSPWFLEHGVLSKSDIPEWSPKPEAKIELLYGSLPRHFIGRALMCCLMDEISFITNQDVEIQKRKAMELVSSATARMQSRFMRGEKNPTIMVLASSKRTEQSFLETWIANKKKNESKTTWIVDEPQWVIREDKNSTRKFKVAIGNKFLSSEVLPLDIDEDGISLYRDRGYKILDVPMGYYENFIDDIDIALTDIAGISTTNISNYISGERIAQTKFEGKNPFTKDIIIVGNGKDDETQYSDFFDLSLIPEDMKYKPLYMHLDMSLTGDKTGICGTWIKGKRPNRENETNDKTTLFQLAFIVSVKAPKGHQISFAKTRNFILWLKQNGFNIKGISMDTFQSASMLQDLQSDGFDATILSVDRVQDKICIPYQYLKSTIYDQRILIPKVGTNLLTEELIGLERNNTNGKIDHSPSGINSKDSSDALCGSLYTASQHIEEFILDYGETIQTMLEVSGESSEYAKKQQITVDFEEELKKMHNDDIFSDFGMGKAKELSSSFYYASQGIII